MPKLVSPRLAFSILFFSVILGFSIIWGDFLRTGQRVGAAEAEGVAEPFHPVLRRPPLQRPGRRHAEAVLEDGGHHLGPGGEHTVFPD